MAAALTAIRERPLGDGPGVHSQPRCAGTESPRVEAPGGNNPRACLPFPRSRQYEQLCV